MKGWMIWGGLGLLMIWMQIRSARKQRKDRQETQATYETEDATELQRESNFALLIRDQSRYARNYANDMGDTRLSDAERERFRRRYEDAKSKALTELLTIKDDFYRGVAAHGVIDLLLAGGELGPAKRVFDSLDESLRDSIVSTRPDEYACLRA